jgi:hypothetical protein
MRIFNESGVVILDGETGIDRVKINARYGDISAGGNGRHGDIVLFNREATNVDHHSGATIHLNGGVGDIRVGGNGKNGDIQLYPHGASEFTSSNDANIHLDGHRGHIQIAGRLKSKDGYGHNTHIRQWSVDEGVTTAYEGNTLRGEIEFTHEADGSGSRNRLRAILIFNPRLNENSMVVVTSHGAAGWLTKVAYVERRHTIVDREGWTLTLYPNRTLPPGTNVRVLYWIVH